MAMPRFTEQQHIPEFGHIHTEAQSALSAAPATRLLPRPRHPPSSPFLQHHGQSRGVQKRPRDNREGQGASRRPQPRGQHPPPRRRSLREGGTRRGRLLSRARTARPRLRSFINSPGLLSSRFIVPGRTGKGREDRRGLRCARCPLSLEERGYPEAPAHRLLPCPCAPAPLTSQGRAGVGWSWEAGRHEDVHRLLLAAARIRNSLCVRERGLGK